MLKKIFIAMLCFNIATQQACAKAPLAEEFINNIADNVLRILKSSESSEQQKQELIDVFAEAMEIEWMAKFALGRNWPTLTAEQKQRYLSAYRNYLIKKYISRFVDYKGQKLTITSAQQLSNDNYVVNTYIVQGNNATANIKVDYRLSAKYKSKFGNFKIIDIVLEDVSMITSQRSEFGGVIATKGLDGLLQTLGN